MSIQPELLRRAEEYCEKYGLILVDRLEFGVHGSVFAVESQSEKSQSAVKVHERERPWCRERDGYLRLKEWAVSDIRGCAVPQMLHCDDELWGIQMTVVTRPFVLDFAGAYLDEPPDFSEEVLAEWHTNKLEVSGERRIEVQAILRELEGFGVFMRDVNPGNIFLRENRCQFSFPPVGDAVPISSGSLVARELDAAVAESLLTDRIPPWFAPPAPLSRRRTTARSG